MLDGLLPKFCLSSNIWWLSFILRERNFLKIRALEDKWSFFFHFYFFIYFGHDVGHVGSWFPDQGLNPHPLQWKCGVLTADHQESPAKWYLEEPAGGVGGGVLESHLQEKSLPEKASLFCGWQVMLWGVTYSPGKGKILRLSACSTGQGAGLRSPWWPRGPGWGGRQAPEGGTYVYLGLIHIVVRQMLTQHCKAITLQSHFFKNKTISQIKKKKSSHLPSVCESQGNISSSLSCVIWCA